MWFGIIYYEFKYVCDCDSICIKAMTLYTSPKEYLFSKRELQELHQTWNGVIPVYRRALSYFPKENKS